MMEVPSYADRANLLITTTVADKSKYNFPVINARAFFKLELAQIKQKKKFLQKLKKIKQHN